MLNEMMIEDHARELQEEMNTKEREQDLVDRVWVTKDGARIRLLDMKDGHVRNCIAYLAKYHNHPSLGERWSVVFQEELARRERVAQVRAELCKPCSFGIFVTLFNPTPF